MAHNIRILDVRKSNCQNDSEKDIHHSLARASKKIEDIIQGISQVWNKGSYLVS